MKPLQFLTLVMVPLIEVAQSESQDLLMIMVKEFGFIRYESYPVVEPTYRGGYKTRKRLFRRSSSVIKLWSIYCYWCHGPNYMSWWNWWCWTWLQVSFWRIFVRVWDSKLGFELISWYQNDMFYEKWPEIISVRRIMMLIFSASFPNFHFFFDYRMAELFSGHYFWTGHNVQK